MSVFLVGPCLMHVPEIYLHTWSPNPWGPDTITKLKTDFHERFHVKAAHFYTTQEELPMSTGGREKEKRKFGWVTVIQVSILPLNESILSFGIIKITLKYIEASLHQAGISQK